jgi:hypothetical protein
VSTVMNLRDPLNVGKFLSSYKIVGFSRRTQLYEVSYLVILSYSHYNEEAYIYCPRRNTQLCEVSNATYQIRWGQFSLLKPDLQFRQRTVSFRICRNILFIYRLQYHSFLFWSNPVQISGPEAPILTEGLRGFPTVSRLERGHHG